VEGQGFDT
jgi:ABC-type Fe3+-hydroxamate transport system substrate-binding protein